MAVVDSVETSACRNDQLMAVKQTIIGIIRHDQPGLRMRKTIIRLANTARQKAISVTRALISQLSKAGAFANRPLELHNTAARATSMIPGPESPDSRFAGSADFIDNGHHDGKTARTRRLLFFAMPYLGPHATLFATDFSPAFSRFLGSHVINAPDWLATRFRNTSETDWLPILPEEMPSPIS